MKKEEKQSAIDWLWKMYNGRDQLATLLTVLGHSQEIVDVTFWDSPGIRALRNMTDSEQAETIMALCEKVIANQKRIEK